MQMVASVLHPGCKFNMVDYSEIGTIGIIFVFIWATFSFFWNNILDLYLGPKAATRRVEAMLQDRSPGSVISNLKEELISDIGRGIDTAEIGANMMADIMYDLDSDESKLQPQIDKIGERISKRVGGFAKGMLGKVPRELQDEGDDADLIALKYIDEIAPPGLVRLINFFGYDLEKPGVPTKLIRLGIRYKVISEDAINEFINNGAAGATKALPSAGADGHTMIHYQ